MADEDTKKVEFTEEQQAAINKLIGDARKKSRSQAQAALEAKLAKEKEVADQTALAANKEWEKLTGQLQTRVKELEPLEAEAKAYGELVESMLKDKIKALGDAAKKAVAGLPDTLTAVEKLDWLSKNEGLFQAGGDGVGTPARPKPKPQDKGERESPCKFGVKF